MRVQTCDINKGRRDAGPYRDMVAASLRARHSYLLGSELVLVIFPTNAYHMRCLSNCPSVAGCGREVVPHYLLNSGKPLRALLRRARDNNAERLTMERPYTA